MLSALYKKFRLILLALVLAIGVIFLLQCSRQSPKEIRNVLLISIDTCRADYLSCYGYPRQTTPHIDAFAAEGVVFENTISPIPITLPAHASMLTGTIPPYHGVHDNSDYQLDQSNVTLAEILKDNGFTTGGIISAFVMDSEFGIDQGFDTYNDRFEQERKTAGDISERIGAEASRFALDWLDQHKNEKFFLFLHYFDPHGDYVPPEPFASKFADNLYAGEIAYTDHCIGLVLSKLKELGLYDSTLIIITADHGEMLGEHGELSHLYFIYQSAIKVPLILRLPGQRRSKRIDELVGLIDIVPTVCSLLGIDVPQHVQGQDLSLCLLGKDSPNRDRHVYCESLFATRYNGNSLLGVVNNRFKYIQTTRPELYDLVQDPYETRNMIKELPRQVQLLQGRLKQMLEQSIRQGEFETKLELDEQSRKRLESLGYAGGGIVEDFDFDQTKDDPKDLIDFHSLNMRVMALVSQQAYDEAKVSAEELVHQRPDCLVGYRHLAEIARMKKDYTGAAVYLKKAIELDPNYANAHNNLGMALALQGKLNEAISYFTRAIQLDPDSASSHYNLGNAFNQQDKVDEAITHYTEAVQIKPDYSEAHNNLGLALVSQGRLDEAITHFREVVQLTSDSEVVQLTSDSASAHHTLARSLKDAGRAKEAIVEFKETLRLKPDGVRAMNSLAWLLATHKEDKLRAPEEAIRLAERACELTNYKDTGIVDTLAAAYASAGRFSDAAATAEKALKLIESTGDTERAQNIQKRLQLYKRGQGYTESAQSKESTIIKK
ncbi:MAG: sulfatase-like hydrolase/transferase [Planctomycetota bacterium]